MGGNVSFRQFLLLEGGNVTIADTIRADSIDLTQFERNDVVEVIKAGLHAINDKFEKKNGIAIWQQGQLNSGKIFSGSARHLFDENIPTEEFVKHKSKVGDVDTMVDLELKDQLEKFLDANKGKTFEGLTLIGWKKSADQFITLWKTKPFNIKVQVDLEFVAFIDGKPSEWANFSHSSDWNDIKSGVKGAFHKILMMSLLAPKAEVGIEQMIRKDKDTGQPREREFYGTEHAISLKGIRKKYKKLEGETREIKGLDGQTKTVPVFKATNSKNFIEDINLIFKAAFGSNSTPKEKEQFKSFNGIVKIIKDKMSPKQQQAVFNKFFDKLFGEGAQGLYLQDPQRDMDEKMVAIRSLSKGLGLSLSPEQITMRNEYVAKYK
ncbi:MAG: hypothetical protein QXN55_00115 [Candidatus Nitrosotenuis sp.]